jgi:hypothetical protein
MTKYGHAAVRAVELATQGQSFPQAWDAATEEFFPVGSAAQKKSCPRSAFLGLAGVGLLQGVPAGAYTRSTRNAGYAEAAARYLRQNPSFDGSACDLWALAVTPRPDRHNGQCDVVLALWRAKCLAESAS